MPRFKNINFYQNRLKIKPFLQKKYKIFECWGLRPQTPKQLLHWLHACAEIMHYAAPVILQWLTDAIITTTVFIFIAILGASP